MSRIKSTGTLVDFSTANVTSTFNTPPLVISGYTITSTSSFVTGMQTAAKSVKRAARKLAKALDGIKPEGHISWMNKQEMRRLLAPLTYHDYVMVRGWDRWGTAARIRWLVNLRQACAKTIHNIDNHLLEHYRPESLDEADRIDYIVNGGI